MRHDDASHRDGRAYPGRQTSSASVSTGSVSVKPLRNAKADHIAIVIHDFSAGGSERIAIRLANQWVRSGRRVTILCGTTDGPARDLVEPGVRIQRVAVETRRGPLSRFRLANRLASDVERLAPDLIFAPGNFHVPVLAALASFLGKPRPPVVCKISNPMLGPGRWFKILYADRIDAFVAMSDALGNQARKLLSRARIVTIAEPILEAGSRAARILPVADPSSALIVCAGRLVTQKDFSLAIKAFDLARIARDDVKLAILGEGPERGKLDRMIRELGLTDRVCLMGHVADIRPTLAKARMMLMTSRYEGYPAVLVEALAMGVPVVATDCSPAIREILFDPSFGQIVKSDARDLADGIASVLAAGPPTPAALTELLDRHRIDTVAPRYLALFDDLVSGARFNEVASMETIEAIHDGSAIPDELGPPKSRKHALP